MLCVRRRHNNLTPALKGEKSNMVRLSERKTVKLPGFVDVHVHFREPGFSYKETILTGAEAAKRGGYCAVCTMPNLNPVPDSPEKLEPQLRLIREAEAKLAAEAAGAAEVTGTAGIAEIAEAANAAGIAGSASNAETRSPVRIYPYGALTVDEKGEKLSDLEGLAPYVIAFSDDGKGVQSDSMMREAMRRARDLNKLIAAHCEVNSLLRGGYIHDGAYAKAHGHRGICSESEWRQIYRDLDLAAATGCRYHVCHVSAKESVDLIRQAKKSGVDVTCETGPHYLVLSDEDLQEDGRFKMNPPLRSPEDRDALIEGIIDGTVDMIATDHAPHSEEEKSRGLEKSAFGIVGLETAFPVLYTKLVEKNIIDLEKLVDLMSRNPARRFGIEITDNDSYEWDLSEEWIIDPAGFASMGRATPFAGLAVKGKIISI
jgi:dihydroorotase